MSPLPSLPRTANYRALRFVRSLALGGALLALPPTLLHAQRAGTRPAAGPAAARSAIPFVQARSDSAAGEYLTIVGGCNDCHTPTWAESNGKTPSAERLVGSNVGYRGPWGTSYAANLRLIAQRASEARWVQILTTADSGQGKPPMPWMNTAMMNERDLRAMYRYIRSLGPRGERTPRALPADSTPRTPYVNFVPVQPDGGR